MPRKVETVYGPMPGCPDCGIIPLSGPHICEHGVTPVPEFDVKLSIVIRDRKFYESLLYGKE